MAEYILRDQAIIAVTGAKLPDVSASGLPIANGKRSVTDCVRRLKEIPAADVWGVVHCADCAHAEESLVSGCVYCNEMERARIKEGFCAWGERKASNG